MPDSKSRKLAALIGDGGGWTYLTSQATTSGTTKDFTIPSGATEIELIVEGVSTDGTETLIVQLGDSGGIEATGYNHGISHVAGASIAASGSTTGFQIERSASAAISVYGTVRLVLADASSNLWAAEANLHETGSTLFNDFCGGTKALSAELTTVRLTTTNTPDDFDAGTVYCRYKGGV